MKFVLITSFSVLFSFFGYSQTTVQSERTDLYDYTTRVIEIRGTKKVADSDKVLVDGKEYRYFESKQQAMDYFENPNDGYRDYIVVYIKDTNGVYETELYEWRQKSLRHKYDYIEGLEKEIIDIHKLEND